MLVVPRNSSIFCALPRGQSGSRIGGGAFRSNLFILIVTSREQRKKIRYKFLVFLAFNFNFRKRLQVFYCAFD